MTLMQKEWIMDRTWWQGGVAFVAVVFAAPMSLLLIVFAVLGSYSNGVS
jgi:hypothetical protein